MAGFVWYTNHRMWKIVPPFTDSWDVLKAYVVDASAYVYWSTPHLQDQIGVGDAAYIFRTVDKPGIVACGRVEETPRQLDAPERKRVRLSPRVSRRPAGTRSSRPRRGRPASGSSGRSGMTRSTQACARSSPRSRG